MTTYKNLIKIHPQKFLLKLFCDCLYYLGAGVCWYEEPNTSVNQKRFYVTWCVISNVYIFGGMLNQYLAYLRSDLTEKQKIDLLQFTFGNTAISLKILVFYLQKSRIKVLFEGFLEGYREFSSIEMERTSLRKALKYCVILFFLAYSAMISALVEAILMYYRQGIPIRTEVTFYPSSATSKSLYHLTRFFIELHWYHAVNVMIMIDLICIACLVFLEFKFKRLQMYFTDLETQFLENMDNKNRSTSEKEFEKSLVHGIKLHKDALWCARNVQYALGNLYSIQVIESIVLLVITLVKMVTSEHTITLLLTNLSYLIGIVVVTGIYMFAAGDVTNEAALVPTCIFHSGWELNRIGKVLRTLMVVALINSQVPVLLTAFGVITLSYRNFIMVLRHSYSFFAIMY